MLTIRTYDEWNKQDNTSTFDREKIDVVRSILYNVKIDKDQALRDYTKRFDKASILSFQVKEEEIDRAYNRIDQTLIQDLKTAYQNIVRFHEQQKPQDYEYDVTPGSTVGQRIVPLDSVGIYVPGGTAAYPSTVLMNAAPAQVAGVERIAMISPPNKDGRIADIILAAAKVAGITEIYTVGGAQGIGALAYGTETIPKVRKIVGPGNIYVALAKREVFGTVGIDMVAGPSEILIYADDTSNPAFVASDLLSQAEHDILARPLLVTTSRKLIDAVNIELVQQVNRLSRQEIATRSLENEGVAILVENESEAIDVINEIAPEHLELLVAKPNNVLGYIRNAGAVFVGPYSPEPLGDYMAGPNHTLPTSGTATFSSALGVEDFIKRMSVIQFTKDGLQQYKDSIIRIAEKEGLTAHAEAVKRRYTDES